MTTLKDRRKVLTDRLSELKARLHGIEDELEGHDAKDWDELAVQREEDEVLEQMGTDGQVEIRKIEAALARMDAGEYGVCVSCGEDISPERLDVVPHTPFCRTCAAAKAVG
jgi:RNA polymerase-binding transcription factor DksA